MDDEVLLSEFCSLVEGTVCGADCFASPEKLEKGLEEFVAGVCVGVAFKLNVAGVCFMIDSVFVVKPENPEKGFEERVGGAACMDPKELNGDLAGVSVPSKLNLSPKQLKLCK